ncbi:MAG: flagellar basal body-associated FliL family protein [Clostridia bacterium]|jgi:flagellar basal body-associated protein FliL|nr:flagellar basal body-associated FliL family protein [Clostridia bacterium]
MDKKVMIAISVVLVIVLGVSMFTLSKVSSMGNDFKEAISELKEEEKATEKVINENGEEVEVEVVEKPSFNELDIKPVGTITTTLTLSEIDVSSHIIKAEINLGLNKTASDYDTMVTILTEKPQIITDTLLDVASKKTYDELQIVGAKDLLKEEIRNALNEKFETSSIAEVYFTQFVTQ